MSIDVTGRAPGGERQRLGDILPLSGPIVVQIFPIYACNFRCKYCTFSIPLIDRGFISNQIVMSPELHNKCIREMSLFNKKVKVLRYVGMGEPLLHKHIAEMIGYADKMKVAERIELLTNASLLNNKMSDDLINAGLTRLLISMQGITSEKYYKISSAYINFDIFLNNIKYFYDKSRGKCKLHIKVIDLSLDDGEKEKFFAMFKDISDTMGVEYASPIFPGVEINKELLSKEVSQFGSEVTQQEDYVCSQSFFTMQINPDGNVVPCYSIVYPEIMGNSNNDTLNNIWKTMDSFRVKMMNGTNNVPVCKECLINKRRLFKEDILTTEDCQRLRGIYEHSSDGC